MQKNHAKSTYKKDPSNINTKTNTHPLINTHQTRTWSNEYKEPDFITKKNVFFAKKKSLWYTKKPSKLNTNTHTHIIRNQTRTWSSEYKETNFITAENKKKFLFFLSCKVNKKESFLVKLIKGLSEITLISKNTHKLIAEKQASPSSWKWIPKVWWRPKSTEL